MRQGKIRLCPYTVGVLVFACAVTASSDAQEGGIEVFAAETLFEAGWRISQSHLYKHKGHLHDGSQGVSDPQDRVLEEHRLVSGIDHGLFPGLTLSALIPVVHRRQRQRIGGQKETLESTGLGDIAVLGKYRVYKTDWERSAFHVALVGGLKLPTGETGADEDGRRLAPSLQPGSGSWDPFAAFASNVSLNRVRLDGLLFYKLNTEGAQGFEDGDFLAAEFDAAYRFLHTKYPGPTASAKVGVQWRHEQRDKVDGNRVADSGSDEIFIRVGLTFHPVPRADLTLAVDLPAYQYFSGEQLALDVRTFFALGFRF